MRLAPLLFAASLLLPHAATAQTDEGGTPVAPEFRPGQIGARFRLSPMGQGIGGMLFTSPTSAWTFDVGNYGTRFRGGGDGSVYLDLEVSAGRRWFGPRHGAVRSHAGVALSAARNDSRTEYGSNEDRFLSERYGANGELGFTIFPAPELGLGASWQASYTLQRSRGFVDGVEDYDQRRWRFEAGTLAVELALFF
jgi:hypothetical protein